MQKSGTPPSLSSHVAGLDDSIERIIQRCLESDSSRRPQSALAVSAALPGGDPLAAALAAGETPSPEMVADADVEGALKPWVAISLLVIAPTALMVTLLTFVTGEPINAIWFFCIWSPVFFLGVRFGLLAMTAGGMFASISSLVRVWDPSSWYFPYVAFGLLLFLLPLLYGFFISMGGHKLIKVDLLDG